MLINPLIHGELSFTCWYFYTGASWEIRPHNKKEIKCESQAGGGLGKFIWLHILSLVYTEHVFTSS